MHPKKEGLKKKLKTQGQDCGLSKIPEGKLLAAPREKFPAKLSHGKEGSCEDRSAMPPCRVR